MIDGLTDICDEIYGQYFGDSFSKCNRQHNTTQGNVCYLQDKDEDKRCAVQYQLLSRSVLTPIVTMKVIKYESLETTRMPLLIDAEHPRNVGGTRMV